MSTQAPPSPMENMQFYLTDKLLGAKALMVRNKWREHLLAWLSLAPCVTTKTVPKEDLSAYAMVNGIHHVPTWYNRVRPSDRVTLYLVGLRNRGYGAPVDLREVQALLLACDDGMTTAVLNDNFERYVSLLKMRDTKCLITEQR